MLISNFLVLQSYLKHDKKILMKSDSRNNDRNSNVNPHNGESNILKGMFSYPNKNKSHSNNHSTKLVKKKVNQSSIDLQNDISYNHSLLSNSVISSNINLDKFKLKKSVSNISNKTKSTYHDKSSSIRNYKQIQRNCSIDSKISVITKKSQSQSKIFSEFDNSKCLNEFDIKTQGKSNELLLCQSKNLNNTNGNAEYRRMCIELFKIDTKNQYKNDSSNKIPLGYFGQTPNLRDNCASNNNSNNSLDLKSKFHISDLNERKNNNIIKNNNIKVTHFEGYNGNLKKSDLLHFLIKPKIVFLSVKNVRILYLFRVIPVISNGIENYSIIIQNPENHNKYEIKSININDCKPDQSDENSFFIFYVVNSKLLKLKIYVQKKEDLVLFVNGIKYLTSKKKKRISSC